MKTKLLELRDADDRSNVNDDECDADELRMEKTLLGHGYLLESTMGDGAFSVVSIYSNTYLYRRVVRCYQNRW